MFCKQLWALIFWCYFHQIVLNPMLQFLNEGKNNIISTHHLDLLYVTASAITVEPNQVALTPGHEITLRCNVAEFPEVQFTWSRIRQYPRKEIPPPDSGEKIPIKADDRSVTINNNVLILKSPTLADVGNYYCRVKNPPEDVELEKEIIVRAKPYIHEFDLESSTIRSAIIVEGGSLKLVCNVDDDYAPESNISIIWQESKFELDENMNDVTSGESGMRVEVYNSTSQALVIDNVTKDHRRFYKCRATNGITENTKIIMLRVRDKYRVVWPTLGIVIELAILIGVIFTVEKNKIEPDRDTADCNAL